MTFLYLLFWMYLVASLHILRRTRVNTRLLGSQTTAVQTRTWGGGGKSGEATSAFR